MAKNNTNTKQGFTIIEVVLVLAIAGLIFLMVFVALPALQRSQRDTQRRNDMSRVDTSLVQYQTNHTTGAAITSLPPSGQWAGNANFTVEGEGATCETNSACLFVRQYMNSGSGDKTTNDFTDPDGSYYSLVITENWGTVANAIAVTSPETTNGKQSQLEVTDAGSASARGTIADVEGKGTAYDAHVVYIVPGAICDGAKVAPSTARHFAILYRLEGAGVYCMDDQ